MTILKRLAYYFYSLYEMMIHFKNWLLIWPIFFRKHSSKIREVRLRQPPVRIMVRGRMDLWSVKETFLDKFYTRYGVEIEDGWTVLDIGAGIGDFSIYSAYGKPNTVIYAFEPFIDSYQLLIKNLTLNGIDNVITFQRALWRQSGRLSLDFSHGEPLQVISQGIENVTDVAGTNTVQALCLQEFIIDQAIERIQLMKLDCEGAEYEILMGAPRKTLTKIERLIMEYHDLGEEQNNQVLVSFLEKQGFSVTKYANFVHDDIGYLFATRST
jgi:FkbM family methyltransferase